MYIDTNKDHVIHQALSIVLLILLIKKNHALTFPSSLAPILFSSMFISTALVLFVFFSQHSCTTPSHSLLHQHHSISVVLILFSSMFFPFYRTHAFRLCFVNTCVHLCFVNTCVHLCFVNTHVCLCCKHWKLKAPTVRSTTSTI